MRLSGFERGTSTLEVIAGLILFAFASAGLAVVLPMAYSRMTLCNGQYQVTRHLEQHLETIRALEFDQVAVGVQQNTEEGLHCNTMTQYVTDQGNSWRDSAPGSGDGLLGRYFPNVNLRGTAYSRIDSQINFAWGSGVPIAGIAQDFFSVRWSGWVEAPVAGNYIFTVYSDDGARLWINQQRVIEHWDAPGTINSSAIALKANQKVPLILEYYENKGLAGVNLYWSGPTINQQLIPQKYLYSSLAKLTVVTIANSDATIRQEARLLTFQEKDTLTTAANQIYVAELKMTQTKNILFNDELQIRVKVCDSSGNPVSGVTVTGNLKYWLFFEQTFAGMTDANGVVIFDVLFYGGPLFNSTVQYSVVSLAKTGYQYCSNLNVESSISIILK